MMLPRPFSSQVSTSLKRVSHSFPTFGPIMMAETLSTSTSSSSPPPSPATASSTTFTCTNKTKKGSSSVVMIMTLISLITIACVSLTTTKYNISTTTTTSTTPMKPSQQPEHQRVPTLLSSLDTTTITMICNTTATTARFEMDSFQRLVFDYSQPPIRSSTTLPDPTVPSWKNSTNATLVVFVMSARHHFEERQVIRDTWCAGHACLFVVGGKPPNENDNCTTQLALWKEQLQYQDLLDTVHPDSYASLTYKVLYAYQWSFAHLPYANWIMKIDDDSFGRLASLEKYVLQYLNSQSPFVMGCIVPAFKSPVHHLGKYAEPLYNLTTMYPTYPNGYCGHVLSRSVRDFLVTTNQHSPLVLYANEDSSLGLWLRHYWEEFPVTWIDGLFTGNGNCKDYSHLSIGHKLTPRQIQQCYEWGDEWPLTQATKLYETIWNSRVTFTPSKY